MLLIDADLRRPGLGSQFDVDQVPGLSDVLVGRAGLGEALRPWDANLTLMPSGYLPPNPAEILDGDAMRALLRDLRARFDVVVIDTPPLVPVTDGAVLAALADGVIVVVRQGKPSRHQLLLAVQRLELVGARLLGSVLNMVSAKATSAYAIYDRQVPREGHAHDARPVASVGAYPAEPRAEGVHAAHAEQGDQATASDAAVPAPPGRQRKDHSKPPIVDRGDGYRIEP